MKYYLEINTAYSLREPESHEALLQTWLEAAPTLFPTHYAVDGPLRLRLDPRSIASIARNIGGAGWVARRTGPSLRFGLLPGIRSHGSIWMEVGGGKGEVIAHHLKTLFGALSGLLAPDYATLHVLTPSEEKEALAIGRPDLAILHLATMATSLSTGQTKPLLTGLRSIYWVNLFGPPYVRLFGRQQLAHPPIGAAVERPASVEITITEQPPVEASYPDFAEKRDQLKEYLGRDAFWPDASRVPSEFRDFRPHPWPVDR